MDTERTACLSWVGLGSECRAGMKIYRFLLATSAVDHPTARRGSRPCVFLFFVLDTPPGVVLIALLSIPTDVSPNFKLVNVTSGNVVARTAALFHPHNLRRNYTLSWRSVCFSPCLFDCCCCFPTSCALFCSLFYLSLFCLSAPEIPVVRVLYLSGFFIFP